MQKFYIGIAVIACLLGGVTSCASAGEKGPKKFEPVTQELPKTEGQQDEKKDDRQESKKIVVAKVNGAEISMYALVKMMNRIGAKKAATAPENIEAIKKEALDRLILQELAWQKARAEGLRTKKENIDTAIANLKENIGGDEQYRQFLEQENVTETDLRAQVERSLTLEAIFEKEVYQKVVVPEEELKKAYEREKGKYIKPEKISVIDVYFFNKTGDESLGEKAASIRSRILADKNKDPWQLVLDDTFIVRNYEPRKEKDRDLFEEAKKLKKDEISRVIKTPDGAHIVKLREYSPERQLTLEEVRPNLEKQLRVPAQELRLREWERELRAKATIEIVDVGSGNTQGRESTSR